MADEEFVITGIADCNWGNALNLTSISYDRGIELIANPDVFLDVIESSVDKGFGMEAIAPFNLEISPTKDISIYGVADTFNVTGLSLSPVVDIAFNNLYSDIESLELGIHPSLDRAISGEAEGSMELTVRPTVDLSLGDGNADGQFHLSIDRMLRSLFSAPPDAEITVLKYQTSELAETLLDGCIVEAGVTTILQVQVLGTRLDTYLLEFFVKTAPDAIPVIYKSSSGNPGGIRLIGINNKATPAGTLQELIAQIVLEPIDTAQFESTATVIYECRMSNKGFGEDYRIAPKKDRGETGLFTIAKY